MKQLISKAQHKIRHLYWLWRLDRRQKCATVSKDKEYNHKVDVVGEIIATDHRGWVKYGCPNAGFWCVENGIWQFDIVERYLSSKDYKMHFVFGFKHAEDALAFRLGYVK